MENKIETTIIGYIRGCYWDNGKENGFITKANPQGSGATYSGTSGRSVQNPKP